MFNFLKDKKIQIPELDKSGIWYDYVQFYEANLERTRAKLMSYQKQHPDAVLVNCNYYRGYNNFFFKRKGNGFTFEDGKNDKITISEFDKSGIWYDYAYFKVKENKQMMSILAIYQKQHPDAVFISGDRFNVRHTLWFKRKGCGSTFEDDKNENVFCNTD